MNAPQDYADLVNSLIAIAMRHAEAFVSHTRSSRPATHTDDWIQGASRISMSQIRNDVAARASAISASSRQPFFCRIETRFRGETDEYLFSKSRFPGVLFIDGIDGIVLSWTSALYATLRGARARESVRVEGPQGTIEHRVISASDWGQLLPTPSDILIREATNDIVVHHTGDATNPHNIAVVPPGTGHAVMPTADPKDTNSTKDQFGLSEIITLADATQREAMHLPFSDSVLIQGPPGSGKTSVGLMRIACLIDRQWTELNLSRTEAAFHDVDTARVLVMNPEMVPYLATLMADISLPRVPVLTLPEFAHGVCRSSTLRSLTGTPRHQDSAIDRVKLSAPGVNAFWQAVQRQLTGWWQMKSDPIRQQLLDTHEALGRELGRIVDNWITEFVAGWNPLTGAIPQRLRLANRLNKWASTRLTEAAPMDPSDVLSPRDDSINAERLLRRKAIPKLCSQITRHLTIALSRDSLLECLEPNGTISPGDIAQWIASSRNSDASKPVYSMADCALHGWITALFALADVPASDRVHFGSRRERLTHAVVDEAQDISIAHVLLLQALLAQDGTITLVGDLRQRLDGQGAFTTWDDLPIRPLTRAMFGVNHRQTKPIGDFVAGLHLHLYNDAAGWSPSSRHGPAVRTCNTSPDSLTTTLIEEIGHWLTHFPSSLIGVLFVEPPTPQESSHLQDALESGLSDHLVTVDVACTESSDRQFRRHSGVVVAPVALTKGLEFDAVVTVAAAALDSRAQRNRLYVGVSRARQGLSVVRLT